MAGETPTTTVKKRVIRKKVVKKKAKPARQAPKPLKAPRKTTTGTKQSAERKRQRFAQEYIVDYNGTRAALAAGYSPQNKNPRAAHARAIELLSDQRVIDMVQAEMDARAKRCHESSDRVLYDLREMVEVCLGRRPFTEEIYDEDGELVKSIRRRKFNPTAAAKALDLLGKNLELWVERKQFGADEELKELLGLIKPTTGLPSERK